MVDLKKRFTKRLAQAGVTMSVTSKVVDISLTDAQRTANSIAGQSSTVTVTATLRAIDVTNQKSDNDPTFSMTEKLTLLIGIDAGEPQNKSVVHHPSGDFSIQGNYPIKWRSDIIGYEIVCERVTN